MVQRAFSVEDGNPGNKSVVISTIGSFSDIDLTFEMKPSGDIYKKTEAAAVKQSVKNILLTNETEKPFNPYFGAGLHSFLFELDYDFDEDIVRDEIVSSIENYEPRAQIINIKASLISASNEVRITVEFKVIGYERVETLDLSLARLR